MLTSFPAVRGLCGSIGLFEAGEPTSDDKPSVLMCFQCQCCGEKKKIQITPVTLADVFMYGRALNILIFLVSLTSLCLCVLYTVRL